MAQSDLVPAQNIKDTSLLTLCLPSNGGLFFALLLGLFLFERPLALLWDGGTCRHIVNGLKIFQEHSVPAENYIWAINPHAPWVSTELLADIAFGAFYQLWGLNGIVLLCSVALCLCLTWAFQLARDRGLGLLPSMLGLVAVMYSASIHWSGRPHILTYIPFLAMYYLTFCWEGSLKRRAVAICITMILWANLHGSFTIGLVMLGLKLVCEVRPFQPEIIRQNATVFASALIASCLNMRGFQLLTYVLGYMTSPVIAFNSDEWRYLDLALGPPTWVFLGIAAWLFAVWTSSPKRPKLAEAAFMVLLFGFSIYAMRIIPYFVLAALIAAGPQWPGSSMKKLIPIDEKLGAQEPRSRALMRVWLTIGLAMSIVFVTVPSCRISDFDGEKAPVACTDYMESNKIQGLGFNWDNWGNYLYWKRGTPVFIDDKTDFYPKEFVEEYASLYFARPEASRVLAKYNFKWILIPRTIPLARLLKIDSEWKVVCENGSGLLLVPVGNSSTK